MMSSLILALAAASPAPAVRLMPPGEPIALTLNSWGRPLFAWRIEGDGSIVYAKSDEAVVRRVPTRFVDRRMGPSVERYRWVRDLLAPARRWAGKRLPCLVTVTDLPYGEVRWGEAPPMVFNTGCGDAPSRDVTDRLARASRQVELWSRTVPPKGLR